jgi:hypothetical protein
MEEQAESQPKPKAKQTWAERLRGRTRMAVVCVGGVFALGLFCVANPLSERIAAAQQRADKAAARGVLAGDVASLRSQADLYRKRVPKGVDLNDWTQYLLEGVRTQRVKLVRMEPKDQASLGPCRVLAWQIQLEGDFPSLCRVVEWMENGPRLVRIDRLVFQVPSGQLSMTLIVRGLAMEKAEATKPKAESTLKRNGTAQHRPAATQPKAQSTKPVRSK